MKVNAGVPLLDFYALFGQHFLGGKATYADGRYN